MNFPAFFQFTIFRLSADSQLVSQAVTQQISDGLRSALMTTAGISMMFFMSPQLALVSLGIVPPVAAWAVYMGRKVRATSRNVQDALAQSTHVAALAGTEAWEMCAEGHCMLQGHALWEHAATRAP